jgi:hypothetical protein
MLRVACNTSYDDAAPPLIVQMTENSRQDAAIRLVNASGTWEDTR